MSKVVFFYIFNTFKMPFHFYLYFLKKQYTIYGVCTYIENNIKLCMHNNMLGL